MTSPKGDSFFFDYRRIGVSHFSESHFRRKSGPELRKFTGGYDPREALKPAPKTVKVESWRT